MALSNSLTKRLGIQHPIFLAAMSLVSDARLTLAVSKAEGFGFLGAGYGDADWLERELSILEQARASAGDAQRLPFGVGFITWSLAKQPELLDRTLAAKPDAVWLSFGDPAPFVQSIKDAGALVVCQAQDVATARDAAAKGADIIIAQGGEAGGHGASQSSLTLVPAIVDAVKEDVPVLLAGGAADGRGLAAALTLGAQGIVMGTRFYASAEAAGTPAAKQCMVSAAGDETRRGIILDISRRKIWPAPYTVRCIENDHLKRWHGRELELIRRDDVLDAFRTAVANDDLATSPVIAGEAVALIHDLPTAGEIVHRTVAEAERILARTSANIMSVVG